jgi:hypothetical protein
MAMNDILLDMNAYAAFKQGQSDAVEIVQRTTRLGLSSTVLGELLAGFAVGSREAKTVRNSSGFWDQTASIGVSTVTLEAVPPNTVFQPTAAQRARSELFCVLESLPALISVTLAKAAWRRLNHGPLGRVSTVLPLQPLRSTYCYCSRILIAWEPSLPFPKTMPSLR